MMLFDYGKRSRKLPDYLNQVDEYVKSNSTFRRFVSGPPAAEMEPSTITLLDELEQFQYLNGMCKIEEEADYCTFCGFTRAGGTRYAVAYKKGGRTSICTYGFDPGDKSLVEEYNADDMNKDSIEPGRLHPEASTDVFFVPDPICFRCACELNTLLEDYGEYY